MYVGGWDCVPLVVLWSVFSPVLVVFLWWFFCGGFFVVVFAVVVFVVVFLWWFLWSSFASVHRQSSTTKQRTVSTTQHVATNVRAAIVRLKATGIARVGVSSASHSSVGRRHVDCTEIDGSEQPWKCWHEWPTHSRFEKTVENQISQRSR